jgi:hypothetical protein
MRLDVDPVGWRATLQANSVAVRIRILELEFLRFFGLHRARLLEAPGEPELG